VRAGLYVRVSTEAQAERWSLPAQKRALVDFAEHRGWTYEIYEDAGISGETLDARPAMLRLLDNARSRRIHVAVAVEMERFSRSESLFDWLVIKQAFREGRVRFGTPQQLYDPSDTEDDFLTDLFGALSKREKRKLVDRARRGRIEAARRGRFIGSRVPLGFRRGARGSLEIDPAGADAVRFMFSMAERGASVRAIAQALVSRAIAAPLGARAWHMSTVHGILTNPAYIGRWRYGVTAMAGASRMEKPADEWIEVPVPAIISEEAFRRVGEQLRINALWARRRQKTEYLLRGLLRCGLCGSAMVGTGGRPNRGLRVYRYYRCTKSIAASVVPGQERCAMRQVPVDLLDRSVWAQVVTTLRQPDVIMEAARRYQESHVSERDELLMRMDGVRSALARIPEERERAQTLYREGYATLEETKTHLAQIERKRDALIQDREELETRLAMRMADEVEADRLDAVVRRVVHRLDRLSPSERSEVVRAFVRRVVVRPGPEIEVHALVPFAEVALAADDRGRYVGALWSQSL
jgi:site-specific DNA recombinase